MRWSVGAGAGVKTLGAVRVVVVGESLQHVRSPQACNRTGIPNGTLSVNLLRRRLSPSTCSPTSFTPSCTESSCSSLCKNADSELSGHTDHGCGHSAGRTVSVVHLHSRLQASVQSLSPHDTPSFLVSLLMVWCVFTLCSVNNQTLHLSKCFLRSG